MELDGEFAHPHSLLEHVCIHYIQQAVQALTPRSPRTVLSPTHHAINPLRLAQGRRVFEAIDTECLPYLATATLETCAAVCSVCCEMNGPCVGGKCAVAYSGFEQMQLRVIVPFTFQVCSPQCLAKVRHLGESVLACTIWPRFSPA